MPALRPEDIVIRPILSEKTWREMEAGKYTFAVHPDATKPEIRQAIEEIFKVKVEKVWTMYRPGKPRRTRLDRRHGRTSEEKRAVVKLAPGHKIEIAG
ncbi:MAG: 50S ribosomal protein L23 [Candidatus Bipolaricaulota bacterium]|nr:50S ribosomal protein L23 [Candidatus Bipolaricaulota bacterium]MDW8126276.1 50S ribosomal protein L23 [Candidatus Bipolaricaulota bacterium]